MISHCAKHNSSQHVDSRLGFVLVMVLVLLTVAAISLSGLARRSLQLAADAADAQAEFKRKWQTASLQQALLANVEPLLASQIQPTFDNQVAWPQPSTVEGRASAGELQFQFLLADEDAKVNVNQILRQKPDAYQSTVMTLTQSTSAGRLLPSVPPTHSRQGQKTALLQSWGQVFQPGQPNAGESSGRQVRDATGQLTCWGGGRLNVTRASDTAIQTLCGLVLRDQVVGQLLKERRAAGLANLDDLIGRLELKAGERFHLQRLLTDSSNCFSLWLHVSNGQRDWNRLVVSSSSRGNTSTMQTFTW